MNRKGSSLIHCLTQSKPTENGRQWNADGPFGVSTALDLGYKDIAPAGERNACEELYRL